MSRDPAPHPPPPPRSLRRRDVLVLTSAGLLAAPTFAPAEPEVRYAAGPTADFIAASQRLTGFAQLPADLAARVWSGLTMDAGRRPELERLARTTLAAPAGSDLSAALASAGLGDAGAALVAAWYTGSLGFAPDAPVVSYGEALMYAAVADGLAAPTYALGGPGWWAAPPPPAGVDPPQARPAAAEAKPGRG